MTVRPYDVITFDCYGTLIDWNRGLRSALRSAVATAGGTAGPAELLSAYHELEPIVEAESHQSYREVLTETARRAAARIDVELSSAAAAAIPASLPDWPPFADTNPALERLHAAGYSLGILSNVDDVLLVGTCRRLTVPFDLIVTAERVGSYKPAPGHFETARRTIGGARWLHAAQSYFHDVAPAHALGIPVAWINRLRELPAGNAQPLREFHDLKELADWLAYDKA
ncbi:MAG TPA: HAD-IA family hydrolase [Dehalococcoidia bacterium]|nr:HAD-IA family hydrolase [Dehalococcoidia bacterium]